MGCEVTDAGCVHRAFGLAKSSPRDTPDIKRLSATSCEVGGCSTSIRFEGWRQLELQGPSSGLGRRLGSASAIVVHVRFSRSPPISRALASRLCHFSPVAGD